jgi:hypothetical protein
MALGYEEACVILFAVLLIALIIAFTDVAGNVPDPRDKRAQPPVRAAAPAARPKERDASGAALPPRRGVSSLFSRRRAAVRAAAPENLPGVGIRMERSV